MPDVGTDYQRGSKDTPAMVAVCQPCTVGSVWHDVWGRSVASMALIPGENIQQGPLIHTHTRARAHVKRARFVPPVQGEYAKRTTRRTESAVPQT